MDAQVKIVVGLRGYGKSCHVEAMTAAVPRIIYWDTLNDDYAQGLVCRDAGTFERRWKDVYRNDRFRITVKPCDPLTYFPRFCQLAWECGNLTVVVDECHLYFRGEWCDETFTKIITAGRHRDLALVAVTQKPKRLSDLLRSQCTWWDVFALREGKHRDYMVDRLPGVDPVQLAALQQYEYLHYEDGADCYWRCKDDLTTGQTRKERLEYAGQSAASAPRSDPGEHASAQ